VVEAVSQAAAEAIGGGYAEAAGIALANLCGAG